MDNPVLPTDPVDRYELVYYTTETRHWRDVVAVTEIRLRYFVNASWEEVTGRDDGGAPFVDQWQVFVGGHFNGRNGGWQTARNAEVWRRAFATRLEAEQDALRHLHAYENELETNLARTRARISELSATAGGA